MAIYQKKVSVGSFLKKGEDIKDGDIVTILDEGKQVEGNFGTQDLFMVRTASNVDGNVSFNTTTINCLIDAFGEDSKNWVGKQVKVWAIRSNVQGKMVNVFYFTHPKAEIDNEGLFTLPRSEQPQQNTDESRTPEGTEEITVDQIPF